MTLIVDRKIPRHTPQTHALVIGVSEYPHLLNGQGSLTSIPMNLAQLASPTVSASAVAEWVANSLVNPKAELGTVEVLLSPGKYQIGSATTAVESATFDNIKAAFARWFNRCDSHDENVGLFYFCGHGIERGHITVLLPEDFGFDPLTPFDTAIDFTSTFRAMADCKAAAQCYFLDSCREQPIEAALGVGQTARPLLSGLGLSHPNRAAPVLRACGYGQQAHAPPGDVSFFARSLLDCLRGTAGELSLGRTWRVTTDSLSRAMLACMQRVLLPDGTRASCSTYGSEPNLTKTIHQFTGRAPVLVTLTCNPSSALADASLSATDGTVTETRTPKPEAWETVLPSGTWDLEATFPQNSSWNDYREAGQLVHPPVLEAELPIVMLRPHVRKGASP